MPLKFRTLLHIACAMAATSATAGNSFELGQDLDEFRRSIPVFVLNDLALGEEGIVNYPVLCAEGDRLMALRDQILSPQASGSASYRFTRVGPNALALAVDSTSLAQANFTRNAAADTQEILKRDLYLAFSRDCAERETFMIESINGSESASELFAE